MIKKVSAFYKPSLKETGDTIRKVKRDRYVTKIRLKAKIYKGFKITILKEHGLIGWFLPFSYEYVPVTVRQKQFSKMLLNKSKGPYLFSDYTADIESRYAFNRAKRDIDSHNRGIHCYHYSRYYQLY